MLTNDVVLDGFGRVHELVPAVLDGLSLDDVHWQPDPGANSIGWLLWHLLRVEDDHLADLAGREQVWTSAGFAERFALPYPAAAVGYGQSADEVRAFQVRSIDQLSDYAAAVAEATREIVTPLTEADYARIVDVRWDPPVTLGVRLVSVINDTSQHIGQAAYVRGLRERSS